MLEKILNFIAMDKNGVYIWISYAITIFLLLVAHIWVFRKEKALQKEINLIKSGLDNERQ